MLSRFAGSFEMFFSQPYGLCLLHYGATQPPSVCSGEDPAHVKRPVNLSLTC